MKTYKLLKDLPRAKAGEVVIITNAHSNNPWILKINKWNEDEKQRPRLAYIHTKNVDEWLEEIPEKQKSVWDLKAGDSFYLIFNGNILKNSISYCEHFKANYLEIWNAFLSKEEAEQELAKRKALQRIKKYCYENDIKLFSDKEIKEILEKNVGAHYSEVIIFYFIHYKMNFKKFDYSCLSLTRNQECFYFEKEKDIKKVIVNCEKDLKIIFDV